MRLSHEACHMLPPLPPKGLLFLYFPLLLLSMDVLGQPPDMNNSRILLLNEVNTSAARHLLTNFSPSAG